MGELNLGVRKESAPTLVTPAAWHLTRLGRRPSERKDCDSGRVTPRCALCVKEHNPEPVPEQVQSKDAACAEGAVIARVRARERVR